MLMKKDSCRKKAKRMLCPKIWGKFRELWRAVKSLICSKRKQFFQTLPGLLRLSNKKFWSVFKTVSKHSSVPNKLTWTQGDVVFTANNPVDIANLLNRYFFSVFNPTDSTQQQLLFDCPDDLPITVISDVALTSEEVCDVLEALDVDRATGPDKIPAKLLKNFASHICSSLCALFNKSLSLGKLPSEWKLSNITPILKSGLRSEVTNYRPISLLPLVSKVLERCIYNKLIVHMSNQLHHQQFGFLKGKSTTSQLLHVLHDIGKMPDGR